MEETRMGIDRKTYRVREESLARKRNQEYHKQLFWNDITNYYKTWNVQASKYNVWASQSPNVINDEGNPEAGSKSLVQRREKLIKLLTEEEQQYAEEMREYRRCQMVAERELMVGGHEDSKKDDLGLILQEERCCQVGKMSTNDHWKHFHPIVEEMERKKIQKSMNMCWTEQIKEKKLREENEEEMVRKLQEETNRQQIIEEEKERELLCQKQEEMKQLRNYLISQMNEIRF